MEAHFACGRRQSAQERCVIATVADVWLAARATIPPISIATLQLEVVLACGVRQLAPVEVVWGVFGLVTLAAWTVLLSDLMRVVLDLRINKEHIQGMNRET